MCRVWSNQLSLIAGLVSEPPSKVEEDGEGQHRRRGRQGADERGHSPVQEHQLSVSRGPGQEAERAAGDAAEVSGGQESPREAVGKWWEATKPTALWSTLFIVFLLK